MDSHYTTQEHPDSDFYALKFTEESPYTNVMVIYGTVKILEDQQLDMATLKFTYNIVDPGDFDHDDLKQDDVYEFVLGGIENSSILSDFNSSVHVLVIEAFNKYYESLID